MIWVVRWILRTLEDTEDWIIPSEYYPKRGDLKERLGQCMGGEQLDEQR